MKQAATPSTHAVKSAFSKPFFGLEKPANSFFSKAEKPPPFFQTWPAIQTKVGDNSLAEDQLGSDVSQLTTATQDDNKFIDCDENGRTLIQKHYSQAVSQVSLAINRLNSAVSNLNANTSLDNATQKLLESYFMTADKGSIEIILSNFVKMESKMSSGIKFKCVGDKEVCDGTAGYVNKIPLTPIRLGPIHICIKNYRLERDFHKTKVIIHEAAHRFIKADDRGYFGIDANDKLKGHSKLAIDNADSYAWFAMNS